MPEFRILVLSDLHMHQGKPNDASAASYLSSKPEFSGPKVNPIEGVLPLFDQVRPQIDWIVCAGDIADKNDSVSASIAWRQLDTLRRKLHARKLIGTVGNHDVDSRREDETQQPDDSLKSLAPRFPIVDQKLWAEYWSNDFVIWQDRKANATLVLVNSCGLHGVAVRAGADPEHLRGQITDTVLNRLAADLPRKLSLFNVLVMHHHIRQHPWLPHDKSHAINGPKLLDVLKGTGAHWFVIHGHQHLPNLAYSDSGPKAPAILSAGSLAAKTYPVNGRTPRNQLYLIDFDVPAALEDSNRIRARVYAWNWTPSVGWMEAFSDSGLPRVSGFGERGGLPRLSTSIQHAIDNSPTGRLRWDDLVTHVEEVPFLVRHDLEELVRMLEACGMVVDYDRWQNPSLFERSRQ